MAKGFLAPDSGAYLLTNSAGKAKGHPVVLHNRTGELTKKYGRDKYVVLDDKGNDVASFDVFEGQGTNRQATGNAKAIRWIEKEVIEFKENQAAVEASLQQQLEDAKEARLRPMDKDEFAKHEALIEKIKIDLRKSQTSAAKQLEKLQAATRQYKVVRTLDPISKSKDPTQLAGAFDELIDE